MSRKPNKIESAIANVERNEPLQIAINLYSGRRVILVLPPDLKTSEALDLIGVIVRDLPAGMAQASSERASHPTLFVPTHLSSAENRSR